LGVRPYASVVPHDATARRGLFIVHRVGDRLLFEIPRSALSVDMLQVGRLARAAASSDPSRQDDFGGDQFSERAIRWEQLGNRVLLRSPSYAIVADSTLAIHRAVQASSYAPIIATSVPASKRAFMPTSIYDLPLPGTPVPNARTDFA